MHTGAPGSNFAFWVAFNELKKTVPDNVKKMEFLIGQTTKRFTVQLNELGDELDAMHASVTEALDRLDALALDVQKVTKLLDRLLAKPDQGVHSASPKSSSATTRSR